MAKSTFETLEWSVPKASLGVLELLHKVDSQGSPRFLRPILAETSLLKSAR